MGMGEEKQAGKKKKESVEEVRRSGSERVKENDEGKREREGICYREGGLHKAGKEKQG